VAQALVEVEAAGLAAAAAAAAMGRQRRAAPWRQRTLEWRAS
jgi:hypothetical protein